MATTSIWSVGAIRVTKKKEIQTRNAIVVVVKYLYVPIAAHSWFAGVRPVVGKRGRRREVLLSRVDWRLRSVATRN